LSKDPAESGAGCLLECSRREISNAEGCGAITEEQNAEIADGSLPRGCLATDVGRDTGYDKGVYAAGAQNQFQVSTMKRAKPWLIVLLSYLADRIQSNDTA